MMLLACFIGLVALICLYLEFFLPGGILALCALCCMIAGTTLFFWQANEPWMGALYLALLIVAAVAVSFLALKLIRRSKDSFCLHMDQEGFSSGSESLKELMGKEGVVSTELKPSGHIRIEGQIYQAVSQGDFIIKDSKIEVVSTRGSYLIVKVKK